MESNSDVFEEDSTCTASNSPHYEDDFEQDSSIKSQHSDNSNEYSTSDKSRQYSDDSKDYSTSDTGKSRGYSDNSQEYSRSVSVESKQYSENSQEYSTSDTVTSRQYSDSSQDYTTSDSVKSELHSEVSRDHSASGTGTNTEYSVDSASYSNSDTTKASEYSDDFEEVSTLHKSADKDLSSIRYSDDFETIKTSIVDTSSEETVFSDEETGREQSSESTYSRSYEYSTSYTSTESSYSTREYSDQFEDTSRSVFTTESESVRGRHSSDTSYTDSLTDHSTWADSSEYSEATSEATYLAENNFVNKILTRLKQQPSERIAKKATKMITEMTPQEKAALKSKKAFCKKMIESIKVKGAATQIKKGKQVDSTKLRLLGIDNTDVVEDHGVSHLAINRLRLENTRNKYDKMIRAPIHIPDKCQYCLPQLELLAKDAFIKEKLHMVQESRIRDAVDRPCTLSTTLMMDPVILPGRLQKELSCLTPCEILAKIAFRAGSKTQDPGHQMKTTDNVDHAFSSRDMHSARIQPCPYMHRAKNDCTMIQDDMSKKISQYIQNTEQQVDQVKQDLSDEMERLQSLSDEAFWRLYFSKLHQCN